MADLRVNRNVDRPSEIARVDADARRGEQQPRRDRRGDGGAPRGAEELAAALSEDGRRPQLLARFETDDEGEPMVRIVDRESDETIALVTPETLRAMAEQTGLPVGLLVQARS